MDNLDFMEQVSHSYNRSIEILQERESKYATEYDRLVQFYKVAELLNSNPVDALLSMASKHFSSLAMMARHPNRYTLKDWNESSTDLRNYTFLLDALLIDMGIK